MRCDEVFAHGFEHDWLGDTGKGLESWQGETMMKAIFNRRLFLVGEDYLSAPLHIKINELGDRRIHPWIVWKFLGYWYNVINAYSRTNLTFSKDKLVALGGIIKLIEKRTAMTSLAGLWREIPLDDLLWCSEDPKTAMRPSDYRAPSFSWASLDGRVNRSLNRGHCRVASTHFLTAHSGIPHIARETYLAEVVSDRVETVDPTKHIGEVRSAELVLKGHPVRYKTTKIGLSIKDSSGHTWSHPSLGDNTWHYPWMELDVEADGESGSLDVALFPIMGWLKGSQKKEETDQEGEEGENAENGLLEISHKIKR